MENRGKRLLLTVARQRPLWRRRSVATQGNAVRGNVLDEMHLVQGFQRFQHVNGFNVSTVQSSQQLTFYFVLTLCSGDHSRPFLAIENQLVSCRNCFPEFFPERFFRIFLAPQNLEKKNEQRYEFMLDFFSGTFFSK